MNNKKILIIDDEAALLKILTSKLESAGYEVITAQDGFDGLKKARNEKPDLIILDVMLPKINGYKVSRFLKFDDTYKHIPIIMLTARAEDDDKKLGEETGCDLYLTKPYDNDELLNNISQITNPGLS